MMNAVGREIPDYLLANGREVYQGKSYKDGQLVQKAIPTTVRHEKPQADKLCATIREACEKCGAHDGMTFEMILSAAFSCNLFSLAQKCRGKWRCLSWLVLAILRQRL